MRFAIAGLFTAILLAAAPAPASAACTSLQKMLGCRDATAPAAAPAAPNVKADGSLELYGQDGGLVPLPAFVRGQPLYPRVNGKLPYGLNGANGDVTPQQAVQFERGFGGTVHRIAVSWAGIEYSPGQFWWDGMDQVYREFVRGGVRPLMVVLTTPGEYVDDRYRSTAVCGGTLLRKGRGCEEPPLPGHVWRLGEFARRMAVRYPLAAGIEIWNEPNLTRHWKGTYPNPQRYAAMTAAVWDAVKRPATANGTGGRPTMRVLAGSLNGQPVSNNQGLADWVFLTGMLDQGIAGKMDGIAVHPYPYNTAYDGMIGAMTRYENVLSGYPATNGLRYAVTETGFTTGAHEASSTPFTREAQATALADVYSRFNAPDGSVPGAHRTDLVIIHSTADQTATASFGLLDAKRSDNRYPAKPAWCKFRHDIGKVTSPLPPTVAVSPDLAARC